MPATLTASQLHAALSADQIAAARTVGIGAETLDPVAEEIAAACAKVDAYCAGYAVAAALLTGWARDLAAWAVAKRVDSPTAAQLSARDRALLELTEVRDGKFQHLAAAATTAAAKVLSGSRDKVL